MYRVEDLLTEHGAHLGLELLAGHKGLKRPIKAAEAHRPGLSLAGYLKGRSPKRMLVFGRAELGYLAALVPKVRKERLDRILQNDVPAIIITRNLRPLKVLLEFANQRKIPLFRTKMAALEFLNKISLLLSEELSPSVSLHGTLVEVFGVGVLIQGESSVGKSETALGLVERGHRLVSDDVVRVRKREGCFLEGRGAALTRHLMEIRGIGIINVAHLYGAVCVRENKSVDIIVQLEAWNECEHYDRVGLDERYQNILSVPVPFHLLPVKPGRDVVLLLETIALNHRLKQMGLHSAKEFSEKQLAAINSKRRKR